MFDLAFAAVVLAFFNVQVAAQNGVWGGINITQQVLCVAGAISQPTCNATSYCVEFVTQQIPQCEALHNDPACWCGNVDPLHYCAVCMSSPTDNTTNPTQTQNALECHIGYHKGCAAWEAYINGSLSSTSSSMAPTTTSTMPLASITSGADNTSSKSTNIGPIVGGAVGGVVGLLIIFGILFLIYRHMQNKHEQAIGARVSVYNPNDAAGGGMAESKYIVSPTSPAPPSTAPSANARTPPPPHSPGGGQAAPHILDPNFNPYFVPTLAANTNNTYNTANTHPHSVASTREHDMQQLLASGGGTTPAPMYQPSNTVFPAASYRDSMATSTGWETTSSMTGAASGAPMMVQNQGYHSPLQSVPQGAMMPPPPHSPTPMDAPFRPEPHFPNEKSQYQG